MKSIITITFLMIYILSLFAGCDAIDGKNRLDNDLIAPLEQATLEITDFPFSSITALIKSNLDALAKYDPNAYFDAADAIDNEFFSGIVALGDDALPYLKTITDLLSDDISWYPNLEIEHQIWAVYAIYAIKPETYNLSFFSFDGKYVAKAIVDSFESFYNHGLTYRDIHIIESSTEEIIYRTDMSGSYSEGGLNYPDMNWSQNSRFVVINCGGRRSGSVMAIDMQCKRDVFLPAEEYIIHHVFPGEDVDDILLVPRGWFEFANWETEDIVKIEFDISVISDDRDFSGWYTYDLTNEQILEIEYSFIN